MLSTVHRGAAFEKRALRLLQANLSMSLNRVGGKSDGGIDLRGWWWLPFTQNAFNDPTHRQRVRVFAQCKAEKKKIGPKHIREMEGVLHRHSDDPNPMVALFISESLFTKEALLRMQSSSIPFFLLHLPSMHKDGIGSMVWNHALSSTNGLLQGKVEARWERSEDSDKVGRPGLWVQNQRAPSWTPEKLESYVVNHPLYAPHIILSIPYSDRDNKLGLTLVLEWDFGPRDAVVYYMPCNAMLMLRFFLRVCNELPDTVGPVVRSGSRSNVGRAQVNSQSFFLPKSCNVRKGSHKIKTNVTLTLTKRSS